jgi:hypothetical protein
MPSESRLDKVKAEDFRSFILPLVHLGKFLGSQKVFRLLPVKVG